jgi:glutamate--cysteine ligase
LANKYQESLKRFNLKEFEQSWGSVHRGIEKESLRVTATGSVSSAEHPKSLGSALTNPYITTDFSEALLEFITPATDSIETCLEFLEAIHRFTYQHLDDEEVLWVCSMPCPTGDLDQIPLAQYGNSNIGRLKTLYRRGLHHRYGGLMQTIAGIHYNFSMPDSFWPEFQHQCGNKDSLSDFRTARYLHLIRNFHRYSWLLYYLFGASPVTCKCFTDGREHRLKEYDSGTLYLPYATCLRMSNLGYRSSAQQSLFVCYNELDSYVQSLDSAMRTPYAPYQDIDDSFPEGRPQMNANLLQLENEFYSSIRPKRTTLPDERPLSALLRDGIEYVEVRALDLNPFLPLGIDEEQIKFLDTFLLYCLLSDSPQCDERENQEISANIELVVEQGRDPALTLKHEGNSVKLTEWGSTLLQDMQHAAVILDQIQEESGHRSSLKNQQAKIDNADLTPSGKLLKEMASADLSFFRFAMQLSQQNRRFMTTTPPASKYAALLNAASSVSLERQKEIEESDSIPFEKYLAEYNSYQA